MQQSSTKKPNNCALQPAQIMTPANPPAGPPLPQSSTRMTEEVAHLTIRSSTPVRAFDNVGEVATVAVFPDRQRMATSSSDGILRVWDINNGVLLKELEGSSDTMGHMALSRDGQLIASCDGEGYVKAWHGDTGRPLTQSFKAHSKSCSLDFSPDGATLATGSLDCTTKLWSTVTWQRLQSGPIKCNNPVNFVRYSPNGKLLAIATNQDVQIWNTVTKRHVVCIDLTVVVSLGQGISSSSCYPSYSLVWTPDGTRLLSMCNPIIREWDSSTWKPLEVGGLWRGQTGIAVSCDGTLVAYATTDNHVRVKRLSDRRTIAIFQHSDSPCCITFSMDGKHILAGGKDKKIFQWAVPQHAWREDAPTDQATDQVCSYSLFNSPSHLFAVLRFRNVMPRFRALNMRYDSTIESYNARNSTMSHHHTDFRAEHGSAQRMHKRGLAYR
jgi:WD40 repeat protein